MLFIDFFNIKIFLELKKKVKDKKITKEFSLFSHLKLRFFKFSKFQEFEISLKILSYLKKFLSTQYLKNKLK